MVIGHVVGIMGLVSVGAGFLLMLEGAAHTGESNGDFRLAGSIAMIAGAAVGLSGLALVLATKENNGNQAQVDVVQEELHNLKRRRSGLKRMRLEANLSFSRLGLRLTF